MLTGACLCGDIGFEVNSDLIEIAHCHCSVCRKFHGSAYATFVFVAESVFRWLSGPESVVDYKMPEARVKGAAFCRHCGCQLPRLREPGQIQIPAGSLDADPGIRPAVNIFTGAKAPWSALDESLPCFPEYASPT